MHWDAIFEALKIKISLENPPTPPVEGGSSFPSLQLFTPHVKIGALRHSI